MDYPASVKIDLPKSISTQFGQSIAYLVFDILDPINKAIPSDENIVIDVSPCEFITPLIATPLAILQNRFSSSPNGFTVSCNHGAPFSQYAKHIHFPLGLTPESVHDGDYAKVLSSYKTKTYVPILNFPAQIDGKSNLIRESILQALHNLLNTQLNLSTNFRIAVAYLIDEMVNNVKDHSMAARGFIFAQYYPKLRYLDVCIGDDGLGILGSYHAHGIINYTSCSQAIHAAVNGVSTKNTAGGRGFGIPTSLRMLVEGLRGSFLLMSGNAHILRTNGKAAINEVPDTMFWNGTLVGLRIPFTETGFDYAAYLE
jgi:hypothetical protein